MVLSELFDSGLDVDSLHCTGQCIMMCNDVWQWGEPVSPCVTCTMNSCTHSDTSHVTWQMDAAHHDQLLQVIMLCPASRSVCRAALLLSRAEVTCHVSIVTTDSSLVCHNSISDPCLLFTDLWPLPGFQSLFNFESQFKSVLLNLNGVWKHIVQPPPAPLTVPIDVWKKKNLGCIHNWRDLKVNLLLLSTVEWSVRFHWEVAGSRTVESLNIIYLSGTGPRTPAATLDPADCSLQRVDMVTNIMIFQEGENTNWCYNHLFQ